MSDVKPWLEGGAPEGMRSLLESADELDQPTPEQLAAVTARLAPLLVVGAAATVASTASAAAGGAGSAGAAAALKGGAAGTLSAKVAVAVGAVVAVGGAFQAGRVYEERTAPSPRPEVRVVEKIVEVPAPVPEVAPEPEPEPVVKAPPAAKKVLAQPQPEAEVALLQSAMAALAAGDTAKALQLVRAHEQKFSGGVLVQEREVIAVEALVKAGKKAEAKARAEHFKRRFPTSTHLLKVEALAAD